MSLLAQPQSLPSLVSQGALRQRILEVMWSSGVLVMQGDWHSQQHLGLRGDYCWKACFEEAAGHIEFGVWEWWMARSRTLVHATIDAQSGGLWVSSEVRTDLNGAVLLGNEHYQLFDSVLDYIRELGRRR